MQVSSIYHTALGLSNRIRVEFNANARPDWGDQAAREGGPKGSTHPIQVDAGGVVTSVRRPWVRACQVDPSRRRSTQVDVSRRFFFFFGFCLNFVDASSPALKDCRRSDCGPFTDSDRCSCPGVEIHLFCIAIRRPPVHSWRLCWGLCWGLSDYDQDGVLLDALAGADFHFAYYAGADGADFVLHFHCFEDHERR